MAHTQIKGLASYPFDVDFFSDENMVCIEGEFGAKGAMTVVALLCAIFRNGYYAWWQADLKFRLRREIRGVSPQFLEMVVRTLVRRGFFDKKLFDSDSILTSSEIQRRYFGAVGFSPRSPGLPFLLLSEDDFFSDRGDVCQAGPGEGFPVGENPPTPPYSCCLNNFKNNYYITSTERKEYGGVGEKENPPEGSPQKRGRDFGDVKHELDNFIDEMKNSTAWGESVCKNNRISTAELPEWLDRFLLFCLSEGVEHETLRDMKSHFNRWLPKRIKNQTNTGYDESNGKDRSERRKRIDTNASSASDYSTTF